MRKPSCKHLKKNKLDRRLSRKRLRDVLLRSRLPKRKLKQDKLKRKPLQKRPPELKPNNRELRSLLRPKRLQEPVLLLRLKKFLNPFCFALHVSWVFYHAFLYKAK